jgi:hypothetical protein
VRHLIVSNQPSPKIHNNPKKVGTGVTTGNTFSTKHNLSVVEARSLFAELGFQPPQSGSKHDYYAEVNALAEQVIEAFRPSQEQLQQLRQVQPSRDAMTGEVNPSIRTKWTQAMYLLSFPEQVASAQTIQRVCTSIIPQAQHTLHSHGLTTAAIVDGLRTAAKELQPTS